MADRVDTLIDDLIREGGVASASLASILVAVQDSVENGYLFELSQRIWTASNEMKNRQPEPVSQPAPVSKGHRRRDNRQPA